MPNNIEDIYIYLLVLEDASVAYCEEVTKGFWASSYVVGIKHGEFGPDMIENINLLWS